MSVLLVAGIGVLVAGLAAIGFGIPVKEFSFGNTLILVGAVAACTGLIMLSLSMVVRELKVIARRLGPASPELSSRAKSLPQFPAGSAAGVGEQPSGDGGPLFSRDQRPPENAGGADAVAQSSSSTSSPAPWQDEAAARDRASLRGETSPPVITADSPVAPEAPAPKQRRNLLFSSSSRKERERAAARSSDPAEAGASATQAPPIGAAPPATFDDAWPQSERPRAVQGGRSPRAPSTFADSNSMSGANRGAPAARDENSSAVTVLKSGVVDGMAYSLYSDGSIEAQMPEGMMRFASIDALREHLDQRP